MTEEYLLLVRSAHFFYKGGMKKVEGDVLVHAAKLSTSSVATLKGDLSLQRR